MSVSDRLPPVVLRVEPRAIPRLFEAYDRAVLVMNNHLARLEQEGYLHEAWLGDEVSEDVRKFYNKHIMDPVHGPLGALYAYRDELTRIRETLRNLEDQYRRSEGDNAELWGQL